MKKEENKAILLIDYYSRLYYSKFPSSEGYLLMLADKKYLLLDFRYFEAAKKSKLCSDIIIVETTGKPLDQIKELLSLNEVREVGLNIDTLTLLEYNNIQKKLFDIKFYDVSEIIEDDKIIKTSDELNSIKQAQAITDMAFEHILQYIKPGVSELDIVAELEYFMKKQGSNCVAFDTIALCGSKTSMCHGVSDSSIIENNSFFLLDFGAMFNNYCSDMTRTVGVGKISTKMKNIYDIVLKANQLALKAIKADVLGNEIDKIARDYISLNGYKDNFGHSLGHGVGIQCHEKPLFAPGYDKKIPKGSILSVEPGIYLEGEFGVRIEDLVVVTGSGCEIITKSSKELIIL